MKFRKSGNAAYAAHAPELLNQQFTPEIGCPHITMGMPLGQVMLVLPREKFVRVQRSFAVTYAYVDEILKGAEIKMRHTKRLIPIGRKNKYREFILWCEEHLA